MPHAFLAASLAAAATWGVPASAGAPDTEALKSRGLLPVTEFGAKPDDDVDDTKAIQSALHSARDRGMAAYFPAGVYRVSDTLRCIQRAEHNGRRWVSERRKPCTAYGPAQGERAVLALADNAAGFDDPANPKPLLWFWAQPVRGDHAGSEDPLHADATISFNQVIRDIDFDLRAEANSGAVAIRLAASQGSTIEHVAVRADGAFAGLYDTPGQGGGVYDLTVEGGTYGIYATKASRYPLVVGARFVNQTNRAVHWAGNVLFQLVGFSIETQSLRPPLMLQPGGPIFGRGFALVDGAIVAERAVAVDNRADKALTMQNVYFSAPAGLVKSGRQKLIDGRDGWTLMEDYVYAGRDYVARLGGKSYGSGFQHYQAVPSEAPGIDALIARHMWPADLPHCDAGDLVDVRAFGAVPDDGSDDTDAIQKALDKHAKVLLPAGVFRISRPIRLGAGNHLVGVGKTLSVLREHRNWQQTDGVDALVTTVDDASARPSLSFVMLETTSPGRGALHWRAGAESLVKDVMSGPREAYYRQRIAEPGARYRITGNGGGRWYAVAAEWGDLNGATHHADYYHLLIEGTEQPLRFYALNLERDALWPQAVIRDAANLDIFYFKTEAAAWPKGATPQGVLLVERSKNLRIVGVTGFAHPPKGALVTLESSARISLSHVAGFRPADDFDNIKASAGGESVTISGATPVALYRSADTGTAE